MGSGNRLAVLVFLSLLCLVYSIRCDGMDGWTEKILFRCYLIRLLQVTLCLVDSILVGNRITLIVFGLVLVNHFLRKEGIYNSPIPPTTSDKMFLSLRLLCCQDDIDRLPTPLRPISCIGQKLLRRSRWAEKQNRYYVSLFF